MSWQGLLRQRDTDGGRPFERLRGHNGVEAITTPRYSLDEARSILPELPPQLADALHQGIIGDRQVGPDRRKDVVLRNQPASVFDEVPQDRKGFRSKRNFVAVE